MAVTLFGDLPVYAATSPRVRRMPAAANADRADTAGGARHDDGSGIRCDAPVDEGFYAHGRGEAGGSDRGAVMRAQRAEVHHLIGG